MTFEKKCLVESADILAVHYECGECHATIVVPIHKGSPQQVMMLAMSKCAYCQTAFGFGVGTSDMERLCAFSEQLQRLNEIMKGKNLKLKLEIKCPESFASRASGGTD
jgi:homoaconitase/3-isopropylmalate dehydratase large subunit